VEENFREQRDVGFYVDRLCLTPKYLSKVIRDSSGASAGEWIDDYVILETKSQCHQFKDFRFPRIPEGCVAR
jgi:hypothetical protein